MIKVRYFLSIAVIFALTSILASAENLPEESVFMQYIAGENSENDKLTGEILLYEINTLTSVTDENGNITYTGNNNDSGFMRAEKEGSNSLMTTSYSTVDENGTQKLKNGNICFDINADLCNRPLMIELEYFDEGSENLTLRYVNSVDGGFGSAQIMRTDTREWKTETVNIEDAYFCQADNPYEYIIRIESKGIDTYIRKITVATCTEEEYNVAANAVEKLYISPDAVAEDFELPTADGVSVVWKSENEAVSIEGNTAVLNRDYIPQTAQLSAAVICGDAVRLKSFSFTVLPVLYMAKALTIAEAAHEITDSIYTITVPITVSGEVFAESCIMLISASEKDTHKIKNVSIGTANLTDITNLSANIPYSEDYIYKYYVLANDYAVLKNNPPAKVNPVFSMENGTLKASWDKPPDDYNAISYYKIFVDGIEVARISELSDVENTVGNSYLFEGLDMANSHAVSIVACDHEGLESAQNISVISHDSLI